MFTGFARYSEAPASKHFSRSPFMALAVKAMIGKLEGLAPSDETYNAKLQVLIELVKHHVKEEETEMFKQARQLLGKSELEELGEQMKAAKSKISA